MIEKKFFLSLDTFSFISLKNLETRFLFDNSFRLYSFKTSDQKCSPDANIDIDLFTTFVFQFDVFGLLLFDSITIRWFLSFVTAEPSSLESFRKVCLMQVQQF